MRLFIVDDHQVVMEGLSAVLTKKGHEITCKASSLAQGLDMAAGPWDLGIFDLFFEVGNGLDLIRKIRSMGIFRPILIHSMAAEDTWHQRVIDAGAQGFIHKGSDISELCHAIEELSFGRKYVSPYQKELLIEKINLPGKQRKQEFSDREEEVLEYIAKGYSTKRIGEALGITDNTVNTLKRRIMKKSNITGITELISFAVRRFN